MVAQSRRFSRHDLYGQLWQRLGPSVRKYGGLIDQRKFRYCLPASRCIVECLARQEQRRRADFDLDRVEGSGNVRRSGTSSQEPDRSVWEKAASRPRHPNDDIHRLSASVIGAPEARIVSLRKVQGCSRPLAP